MCETVELVCLWAPQQGVCHSPTQTPCHPLHPPHGSDTAIVNIRKMLLNNAELCVHHEVPGCTRPQISKSVAMMTTMFILKSKRFLILFSIFPRNADGNELGKNGFPHSYKYFSHFIILISMNKVTHLNFKSMEEQLPDISD